MCGVIGLVFEHARKDLGLIAAELLKTLEYRGYDSTGAAVQGDHPDDITLVKGVGAPSVMVHQLGIVDLAGRIFCGQVRWATFGAVDDTNSQPHLVKCKVPFYGAHNGNVTNCDELKVWLTSEGHQVASDNDGEMVVHTIEHFFGLELAERTPAQREDMQVRRTCLRAAVVRAWQRLHGSFAAVVVDPVSGWACAIKGGSSLYFGLGQDEVGGKFCIASSDLSSVLKLTRVLVPLSEGEMVEYGPGTYQVYRLPERAAKPAECEPCEREPVRSRLRTKDTALIPPFETFMDQEISAQEQTCRDVVTMFLGGTDTARAVAPLWKGLDETEGQSVRAGLERLLDQYEDATIEAMFHELANSEAMSKLADAVPSSLASQLTTGSQVSVADKARLLRSRVLR